MRTLLSLLALSLMLLAVPSVLAHEKATVNGTVTFEGKPLPTGKVAFHPEKGKAITATIKDGKFTAKDVPVGDYHVTFESKRTVKKDKEKEEVDLLPAKYGKRGTTPLKVMIKEGKNVFDFVLQ